jgi:hypothetical protein
MFGQARHFCWTRAEIIAPCRVARSLLHFHPVVSYRCTIDDWQNGSIAIHELA